MIKPTSDRFVSPHRVRLCPDCQDWKPIGEFGVYSHPFKRRRICKPCYSLRNNDYRNKYRAKTRKARKASQAH